MEKYLNEYEDKKVLITGGAGCIGSNLTRALLKADVEKIFVLDDLSSSKKWNVPNDPSVAFIHGSILNDESLKNVFSQKPNYVFHLAAHFANQNSIDHPETNLLVNGLGTLKVLKYSQIGNVEKFLFASSGCSVYGSNAPLPLKEEYVSLYLDSPYQITKLLGELYCNFFHNYHSLPVAIGRLFNVYGPREIPGKYRNVIPNFIYWAMHGQQLPIMGTGEETRDFTFVDDVVEGVLRAAVVPEAVGQAINLASGTETKIIDLANMINELTGNNGLRFVETRSWDKIVRRRASVEKARKLIEYESKTEMKEGLKKTVEWFASNKNIIENSVSF